jgi:hypothetical protein
MKLCRPPARQLRSYFNSFRECLGGYPGTITIFRLHVKINTKTHTAKAVLVRRISLAVSAISKNVRAMRSVYLVFQPASSLWIRCLYESAGFAHLRCKSRPARLISSSRISRIITVAEPRVVCYSGCVRRSDRCHSVAKEKRSQGLQKSLCSGRLVNAVANKR